MLVLHPKRQRSKRLFWLHKILVMIFIGLSLLSTMGFKAEPKEKIQPDPQVQTSTPEPAEAEVTMDPTLMQTQGTLTPNPEEVGSTTGIIIWGTVLILILVIGTLRETFRRKGQ